MSCTHYFHTGYEYLKKREYAMAMHYFRRGSYGYYNNTSAFAYVGYCYEMGYGTPQDLYRALHWYGRALEKGGEKWSQSWVGDRFRSLQAQHPQPPDTEVHVMEDPVLGRLEFCPSEQSSVVLRIQGACIRVYVPEFLRTNGPFYDALLSLVMKRLDERENRRSEDGLPALLDESFERKYDCVTLKIGRTHQSRMSYNVEGEVAVHQVYTILVPQNMDVALRAVRESIIGFGMQLLKQAAEAYLTQRLAQISQQTGLPYKRLSFGVRSNLWGYFHSRSKSVWLNRQLIKLPRQYIDAVLVHELCHQLRLSHDSKFYDLVAQYGGEELLACDLRVGHISVSTSL